MAMFGEYLPPGDANLLPAWLLTGRGSWPRLAMERDSDMVFSLRW